MLTLAGSQRMVDALPRCCALATAQLTEVQGPGYQRQTIGEWTTRDGRAFAADPVDFGPARYGSWDRARYVVLVDASGWEPVVTDDIDFTAFDGDLLRVTPHLEVR